METKHKPEYIANLGLYDAWLECDKDVRKAAKLCEVKQSKMTAAIAWVRAIPITSQNQFFPETGRVILKNPAHVDEYDRLLIERDEVTAYNYARCVTLGVGRGASHRPDVVRKPRMRN